jgi:hypothetical protein
MSIIFGFEMPLPNSGNPLMAVAVTINVMWSKFNYLIQEDRVVAV